MENFFALPRWPQKGVGLYPGRGFSCLQRGIFILCIKSAFDSACSASRINAPIDVPERRSCFEKGRTNRTKTAVDFGLQKPKLVFSAKKFSSGPFAQHSALLTKRAVGGEDRPQRRILPSQSRKKSVPLPASGCGRKVLGVRGRLLWTKCPPQKNSCR